MNSPQLHTLVRKHLNQKFDLPDDQVDLMLPEFKNTLVQHLNELQAAHQKNNLTILNVAAHKIKGALLNLGLQDSAKLAEKIESESASGSTTFDYSARIDKISSIIDEFVTEQ